MSIYQPRKLPVQHYKSTDTGAPQLTSSGAAGEIKTLLKACLKTGYGSKKAATGWDMPYEQGNIAVFKSADPTSTGKHLRIDDNMAKTSQATCYKTMTAISTGTGQWFDGRIGHLLNTGVPTAIKWQLIASPLSVFAVFTCYQSNGKVYNSHFYFGDFQSTLNTDDHNCMLWASRKQTAGEYVDVYDNPFIDSVGTVSQLASAYNQTGSAVIAGVKSLGATSGDENPLGELSHPAYIEEKVSAENRIRGVYPFFIAEKKENRSDADVFLEKSINGRNFLSTTIGWKDTKGAHSIMVPLDFWEY